MSRGPGELADVGMGCARLGEAIKGVSWRENVAMVRAALAGGVTHLDTADAYTNGTSERLIGRATRGSPHAHIATKAGYLFRPRSELEARARLLIGPLLERVGRRTVTSVTQGERKYADQDFSAEYLRSAVEASLKRLRRDHIDLFQLHAPRQADIAAVSALAGELIRDGSIRRFGIAVEDVAEAERWIETDVIDSVQVPFSVFDPVSATPVIERARARGTSVIARSVLGTGLLWQAPTGAPSPHDELIAELNEVARDSGRTARDLALGYARAHPGVDVVLVGIRLPQHLSDLLESVRRPPLPDDVVDRVRVAVNRRSRPR